MSEDLAHCPSPLLKYVRLVEYTQGGTLIISKTLDLTHNYVL